MTHICVSKSTSIGSDNGLSSGRHQAIIWTSAGILLIRPLGTNFSEILIGVQTFSFKKMELNMSSPKWRPFCLGLNELRNQCWFIIHTLRPRQHGYQFADDIFKINFLAWKLYSNSQELVSKYPINNKPAMVQTLVWRQLMTSHDLNQWWPNLWTHLCITWPQWVDGTRFTKISHEINIFSFKRMH